MQMMVIENHPFLFEFLGSAIRDPEAEVRVILLMMVVMKLPTRENASHHDATSGTVRTGIRVRS